MTERLRGEQRGVCTAPIRVVFKPVNDNRPAPKVLIARLLVGACIFVAAFYMLFL